MAQNSNLRGIVAMSLSSLFLISSDLLLKLLLQEMPIGEVLFLRGACILAVVLLALAAIGQLRELRHLADGRVWLRTSADAIATVCYLPALAHMPIGNATVMLQLAPLAITGAAAIFLRERVGWRRWTAIAAGFLGVVIVARPGMEGFSAWSLLVFGTVAAICFRDLLTRRMPLAIPGLVLVAGIGMMAMPIGLVLGLFEAWTTPRLISLAEVAASASLLICGYYLVIVAMRSGEVAVVSTFRYVIVPYAILIGFLVWGDIPDLPMILGTVIILAAGLYVLHRERLRVRRSQPARP